MAAPKSNNIPADKLKLYEKLVATNQEVEQKGASVPCTSRNGHMFSYLNASGVMALKLPKKVRDKFLKKYETTLFEAYGIVQKEFITVPDSLLKKTDELKTYFDLSYEYVGRAGGKLVTKKNWRFRVLCGLNPEVFRVFGIRFKPPR